MERHINMNIPRTLFHLQHTINMSPFLISAYITQVLT